MRLRARGEHPEDGSIAVEVSRLEDEVFRSYKRTWQLVLCCLVLMGLTFILSPSRNSSQGQGATGKNHPFSNRP